jgi:hypothetical protein
MPRIFFLIFLSAVLCTQVHADDVEDAKEGTMLDLPEGKPWEHPDTGLRLPREMAQCKMESICQWQDPQFGTGIRYLHTTDPIRAEVFVYPSKSRLESREEKLAAVREELGSIWLRATKVEKTGRYKNLKRSSPVMDAISLPPDRETLLAHTALTMELQQRDGQGYTTSMWYGVIPFKNSWVRIRVTAPEGGAEEAEEKSQAFVRAVILCVQEPHMREVALEGISAYKPEPLTETGRKAGDFIMMYAKDHPHFSIVVPPTVTKVLAAAETLMPEIRLDLQRAFFVGATETALQSKSGLESNQAGAILMQEVLSQSQKRHPQLQSKEIQSLQEAVKAHQVTKWLTE